MSRPCPRIVPRIVIGGTHSGVGKTSLTLALVAALRRRAVHHLSFGEKKRVCLAGVLAMNPATLILDEPTQGLDPKGESTMLHLLHRLNRERGVTIVLVTHSVDMLPLFVNSIYVREGPSETGSSE